MAGIVFPDLGGTIGPLIQMDRQREAQAFQQERATKQDALHAQERADNLAFRKDESQYRRASLEEQRALRLQNHIASMDEKTRAKVKDFSEFRSRGGMAVLSAPPDQQEQAYGMFLQEAKSRGYDMSLFPQQWGPATANRLKFDVDQAKPFADFFSQPQAMPPVGGGAPAPGGSMPGGGGGYSPSAFMQGRIKRGDDPVTAAAWAGNAHHESSFNPTAFNPKDPNGGSHGLIQWNGPRAQALRQFAASRGGNPADPEVQQDFLQSEIDADPQFKAQLAAAPTVQDKAALISMRFIRPADGQNQANLRAQTATRYAQAGAPQPTMGTMPQSWEARGANAAPMPNAPAGTLPGGPPPAEMPNGPQFAQAGGIIPQGDAVAGQGDVMTPPRAAPPSIGNEVDDIRKQTRASGGDIFTVKGQVEIQTGNYVVRSLQNPRQIVGMIPVKSAAPPQPKTMEERDREILLRGDPNSPDYAAAYAHLGAERVIPDPQSGQLVRIKPDLSWARRPMFAGANAPQPETPAIPGGKTVTIEPGRGKPLDNSARDDLTKAGGGVLELTELVKSFKPEFGGYITGAAGDVANFIKMRMPDALGGGDATGQADWWQRYSQFANLERNKLFGSALTPGETANFNKAMVDPGMRPEQIKTNLQRQQEIGSKALSRIANSMAASGYNKEAIETVTGIRMGDMPDPMGGVPQAPPSGAKPRAAAPKVGDVQDGYLFKGGDPSQPSSWERVK
jgi:hypothetical protein